MLLSEHQDHLPLMIHDPHFLFSLLSILPLSSGREGGYEKAVSSAGPILTCHLLIISHPPQPILLTTLYSLQTHLPLILLPCTYFVTSPTHLPPRRLVVAQLISLLEKIIVRHSIFLPGNRSNLTVPRHLQQNFPALFKIFRTISFLSFTAHSL